MKAMTDEYRSEYLAYVLRLWCDGPGTPWRAAIEGVRTGERHLFATLPALFAFLESETTDLLMTQVEDSESEEKSQAGDD